MMKFHEMAKKAMDGDGEALEMIVITAPKGAMKGMDPLDFVKKIAGDLEFGGSLDDMVAGADEDMSSANYAEEAPQEGDMKYAAKHKMIVEALDRAGFGKKEAEDMATMICDQMYGGGESEEDTSDMPSKD